MDELCRRDPHADVTAFGAEDRPAYDRILLSDVLAGRRRTGDIALALAPDHVVHHLGTAVVRVDRERRLVHAADGTVPERGQIRPARADEKPLVAGPVLEVVRA